MNAAFVSDEGNCKYRKDYDKNDALFVFREFENSEETFHLFA
jgi:hypothetical protein